MMTKSYSHYESLNVTRDAPTEVIRAAYRSLSQKHHPDKNTGSTDAVQMMMRLNTAYSVLSDSAQREQYDLQLLKNGASKSMGYSLLLRIRHQVAGWDGRVIGMLLGAFAVIVIPISWLIWKDHQSTLQIEGGMVFATEPAAAPDTGWPAISTARNDARPNTPAPAGKPSHVSVIQISGPSGLAAAATELPAPAATPTASAAPAAPSASAKASEFARLSDMLKSMGLGLHKLDLPAMASSAKPPPLKSAEPARALEVAKPSAAPSVPVQAASSVAPPEPIRVREEQLRPAAPEPVRGEPKSLAEASKAGTPPAASLNAASASHAPRAAVIADARSCAPPPYPINAYRNGETGTVLLALLVGSDGRVVESKVQKSSGSSELDKAARKALSLCKFKPAESQSEPTWANLAYVWSID